MLLTKFHPLIYICFKAYCFLTCTLLRNQPKQYTHEAKLCVFMRHLSSLLTCSLGISWILLARLQIINSISQSYHAKLKLIEEKGLHCHVSQIAEKLSILRRTKTPQFLLSSCYLIGGIQYYNPLRESYPTL